MTPLRFSKIARFTPAFVLIVLTLLFFYRLAFTDLILARGDTFAYFYPYWHARNAAFMAGRLPLWSPDLFMGVPLLANSQIGAFYPPNWIVAPLSPPDGIRVSILLHVAWAMAGTYLLARRTLGVDRLAAILAAVLFGLGGYIGAHVEQINQLQGLSWMPWLFLLLDRAIRFPARTVSLLAMGLALQFFTGHTQTVFITVFGLGVYALCTRQSRALLVLFFAGIGALILALPQLIPTLAMTGVSNRRGGLNPNQATAFSFSPFVLGRGLLPSYDLLIFGEYVAYTGVIGIGLALVGIFTRDVGATPLSSTGFLRRLRWGTPLPPRVTWIIVTLVGLFLAFGLYNPLYWWLASLPGFNLFRVPARWLALFALGMALLAAVGLQSLRHLSRPRFTILGVIAVIIGGLAASSALTLRQPDFTPVSLPTIMTLIGWLAALVVLLLLVWRRTPRWLALAAVVELFFASQVLPFNDLSSPEVYHNRRFTTNQLLAYREEAAVFGRLLSISELLFDPGDRFALEVRFRAAGMSAAAIDTAFTAIKMQETLSANLPMLYGLPSVDGFDGGLLPTAYYTAFTSLLLPPDELRTVDGRLREILSRPEECRGACIPDQRWLNLMGVQYLITDKIYDVWHEDIAYDTTFEHTLAPNASLDYAVIPPFQATALNLLVNCVDPECASVTMTLTDEAGEETAVSSPLDLNGDATVPVSLALPDVLTPVAVHLEADRPLIVYAATLVDTRTGDFQQLQPAPWQRILSSDIELYENSDVLPRALLVYQARFVPDDDVGSEMALEGMRDESFDPAAVVYISGEAIDVGTQRAASPSSAAVTDYSATRVVVDVHAAAPAFVLLTDAYYPGWTATVNGAPAEVRRADVMFRAVPVPSGESTVIFEYRPAWLPAALVAGGVAWLLAALWVGIRFRQSSATPS